MGGKDKTTGKEKGPFFTGVAGTNKVTITKDGAPMKDTPVTEKNTVEKGAGKVTENPHEKTTDSTGAIFDIVGVGVTSQQKVSDSDTKEIQEQEATPHTEVTTQTLTIGQTCTCTYQRTLSNADGTYKIDIPDHDPPVKPAN
jgi:hypothetical protein